MKIGLRFEPPSGASDLLCGSPRLCPLVLPPHHQESPGPYEDGDQGINSQKRLQQLS